MKRTSSIGLMLALLGPSLALAGCGDDVPPQDTDDTGSTGDTTAGMMTVADTTAADTTAGNPTTTTPGTEDSSTTEQLPPPEPADFTVTIENVSSAGLMFSPLSPGLWANHEANADVLFELDIPDDDEGLEALAEDGDPSALAAAVEGHAGVAQVGVFDTPVDGAMPAPIFPGESYEFTFTAEPGTRLSLATMLVGSNDMFIASGEVGISLFAGGGQPLSERDVTASMRVWDAGTEVNQAPGQGPLQAQHGGSPNMGPPEGSAGVFPHDDSTRAIPLGPDLITVDVEDDPKVPGVLTITIANISGSRGTLVTPFSSLVWALHTDAIGLFEDGAPASAELEALAEDGNAMPFDTLLSGLAEVGEYGVEAGPILPDDVVEITITPDSDFPVLSFATMVVESNDAFLAMGPEGVQLFDGGLRDDEDIQDDIIAALTAWDAGTEANEVPGAGPNQVGNQPMDNTGPDDPEPNVRRYADVTNDLAGDNAGGFLSVAVEELMGEYTVTITNTSDTTAFSGVLTPTVWALHDDTFTMFELGMPASPGLEALAEDGDPTTLLGELMGLGAAGVADTPVMAMMPGPLMPGDSYEFVVTPDATNRFLSFATMIVPSNDTFAALDPEGVALLDAAGMPIAPETVAADISTQLRAWDAGTEGNQAGAAGADMAPFGAPNSGPSNGNGLVRNSEDDEIWTQPPATGVVRVIVAPVE